MDYGTALPEGFNIPTSAFWLKKDLTPEGNPFKLLDMIPGGVVMDCGLYIGTFTAACMEQGAKLAIGYEASPRNADLARGNLSRYGTAVTVLEAALVAHPMTRVLLTMSGFSGANSVLPSANRPKTIEVPALRFRNELLRVKPTLVKIDVEGAEYEFLETLQPGDLDSVRSMFIEFHPIENREAKIAAIRKFLESEDFVVKSTRLRAFIVTR